MTSILKQCLPVLSRSLSAVRKYPVLVGHLKLRTQEMINTITFNLLSLLVFIISTYIYIIAVYYNFILVR